jgi:GDP-L-fucose synthase
MYGEHDHFDLENSHVIPAMIRKFIEAKKTGEPVTLWGDGTPTRDFLYAGDCAKAIAEACERSTTSAPINLGSGTEIEMSKLAWYVKEAVGYDGPMLVWDKTRPNGQPRRVLDTQRAEAILGWKASTSIIDGLQKTVDWYRGTL